MQRLWILVLILGLFPLGCAAAREEFRPTERATAEAPAGYTAAIYDIVTERGQVGEAKVWSRGAYRAKDGRTVVHVAFELQSAQEGPLVLDLRRTRLDALTDGGRYTLAPPSSVRGDAVVPPGEERRVDLYFTVPGGIHPQDLDALRLHWTAVSQGATYSQVTPFVEDDSARYAYYYTPFYDPFLYHPFYRPRIIVHHRYPFHHHHVY
ncbi:MAG: hypothetical protein HY698_11445 [Deltaproteobacteria bacterium]|nr:hypothetical protein [Deltaproteobacteria bacterium]